MRRLLLTTGAVVAAVAMASACEKLPTDEAAFVQINEAAAQRWDEAANSIQREAMRGERDSALCSMSKSVTRWTGTIERVGTYVTGEISLQVRIAPHIVLRTEGDLQDAGSKIARNTPLGSQVSTFEKGQRVAFSGQFLANARGCLDEASFTDSGSLHDPEFLFAFEALNVTR
jgi:hypothetical protein